VDQFGFPLKRFFSIGVPLHFDHDRLLENAIGNGFTENGVREDLLPVFDGKLGGHDHGEPFDPTIDKVIYILELTRRQGAKAEIVENTTST
jgi:hypothetical protein